MRRRFRLPGVMLLLALAGGVLLAPGANVYAAQTVASYDESRIKAAYLVRFGQFVEWPRETFQKLDGALVIGVINADLVLEGLQQFAANRAATGRPVAVRALKSGEDAAGVHILFIGAVERARLPQHVAAVAGRPVLVVSETEDAIQRGATINFVLVDQRVRFEIALNKAEQSGLVVSSKLLSVATRVYRGELPRRTFFALGPAR